jgi:CRP-like cAMP-binding protein
MMATPHATFRLLGTAAAPRAPRVAETRTELLSSDESTRTPVERFALEYGKLSRERQPQAPLIGDHSVRPEPAIRNRLLAALSPEEYETIAPHLERVRYEQRRVLFEPEEPISHVVFPETMVVSLVSTLQEGGTIEVGTTGCEGMVGLPLFLDDNSSSIRAFAQIPGDGLRMRAEEFTRLTKSASAFHHILLRYTQAFLTQVAQTAACNGTHLVEQRCARWLLMTHDRVAGDTFPLTHEFLAFMLGVRRAGVTIAMRALAEAGLVRYTRGAVEIVDRDRLEEASCECYRVVRAHNERLLPRGV